MRRRRSGFRKEKAIMLTSSALVLTALTATGFYVRNAGKAEEEQIIDFSELEKETENLDTAVLEDPDPVYDMYGQILPEEGLLEEHQDTAQQEMTQQTDEMQSVNGQIDTGELDYDPNFTEVASGSVENPELEEEIQQVLAEPEENEADMVSALPALDFTEEDALVWPIAGNVLVNYSMDRTVYFATLDQYQYSPAIVIAAVQGEEIAAAADGKVTGIYQDPEIGTAVVMELGDGYELTYGQLTELTVSEGDYVTCGEIIGKVAAPTKYYSVEGTNVYFKLTKDGKPVDPMSKLG